MRLVYVFNILNTWRWILNLDDLDSTSMYTSIYPEGLEASLEEGDTYDF